jgi:hypothetical protein
MADNGIDREREAQDERVVQTSATGSHDRDNERECPGKVVKLGDSLSELHDEGES